MMHQTQNKQPDPLAQHGVIDPTANAAWHEVGQFQQRCWMQQARAILPIVVRLFFPAFVHILYLGPYQGFLRIEYEDEVTGQIQVVDVGAINLMGPAK